MSDANTDAKVIVALDFDAEAKALAFVDKVDPASCKLKVGKELFTRLGPTFVKRLVDQGFNIFLDLKFHDIPNTVAKACLAAADLGVWMVNVHASGGPKMLSHTKQALDNWGTNPPKLIAVTVLTSMDNSQLQSLGLTCDTQEQVMRLATMTRDAGLDGVVCSAQEAEMLKQSLGSDFCLVTPGIRPAGSDVGDQKRIMTPETAISVGVDYLVIGRPITQADSPADALAIINRSIGL